MSADNVPGWTLSSGGSEMFGGSEVFGGSASQTYAPQNTFCLIYFCKINTNIFCKIQVYYIPVYVYLQISKNNNLKSRLMGKDTSTWRNLLETSSEKSIRLSF